MQLLVSK